MAIGSVIVVTAEEFVIYLLLQGLLVRHNGRNPGSQLERKDSGTPGSQPQWYTL